MTPLFLTAGVSCGIRVNPQVCEVETDLYNPCGSSSRLGVTPEEFRPDELEGIEVESGVRVNFSGIWSLALQHPHEK